MKKIFISLSLLGTVVSYAQNTTNFKIDPTPDRNYFFDGSFNTFTDVSTGKGLNFPRTDLTKFEFSTTDLGGYQYSRTAFDGMIVYNTATGKTGGNAATQGQQVEVSPGFYYFSNPNGTEETNDLSEGKWVKISDAQANLWINDASAKVAKLKALSDGTTERPDDKNIFVTDEGKVGMGTKKPTEKLEVNGNAKITQMPNASQKEKEFTNAVVAKPDGTLGVVKRATTPNIPSGTEVVFGNPMESTDIMPNETFYSIQENSGTRGGDLYRYSGQSITLPPGNWVVYCAYLVTSRKGLEKNDSYIFPQNASVWLRAIIDDSKDNGSYTTATINGSPTLISCSLNSGDLFQVASGVWLINNSGSSPKTYYVKVSIEPNGYFNSSSSSRLQNLSKWLEDYIFAIKRN
ncbi:hypothetical protein ACT4R9_11095 [Ornithobacterium rhinotracheale]|uniref:hypothetical protein n=1 Tax=Ornithobacterium rhinotracheale TaxID=28251 RepID=UPI003FA4316E